MENRNNLKLETVKELALIRRMAATISIRLLGRGTSRLPMYCRSQAQSTPKKKKNQPIRPSIYSVV